MRKRDDWVFLFTADKLAEAAAKKKQHHTERLKFWEDAKSKVMAEVKESGIEVSEGIAASYSNATRGVGPQVMVKTDLQTKLSECHGKILEHAGKVREFDGWFQVLTANKTQSLPLSSEDWLFFFGE